MHTTGEWAAGSRRHSSLGRREFRVPVPLTSFVGRRRELDALRAHMLLPEVRLLTLTGPAGAGKTRLAIEAASELRDVFDDGVYFVDLAPITEAARVAPAISQTLGIEPEPD